MPAALAAAQNAWDGAPPPTAAPGQDDETFLSLPELRKQYERYVTAKAEEIEEARVARRYYHHVQWTADQIETFRKRNQPVVTFPRVGRKIDGIVGISEQQRQDPKAYPRNPDGTEGADVATCVVRYVTERNEWATKKPQALRQALVDGIAGIEIRLVQGDEKDPDIELHPVQTDDFFYDPRSIRPNFTDARFMGLAKSLDIDEAIELFPDKADILKASNSTGGEFLINSDRKVNWNTTADKQVLMVEHWYKSHGQWCWAFYVGWTILDEGVSPFFDERVKTICRFEMFSAYVDQDGDRYGFVRPLKGMQDEINHRRSNALFRANTRRLIVDKGAVDDIAIARREWARPDGVIEKNPGQNITPDSTTQDIAAQFQFLEDAKNEMEAYANMNPAALAGGATNLSGRAVNLLQKPGLNELGPVLIAYRNWVIRVYRVIWNTAQRFWTSERWIRVTDDQKLEQFIQVNGMQTDQYGRPAMVNALGALDVDIILDEGPDVQNMMQDAWGVLSQMPPGAVPMDILLELMPIPENVKQAWRKKMESDPDAMMAKKLALHKVSGEIDNKAADTDLKKAQALSALGSAAHKGSIAHLDSAKIFSGGLQAISEPPPQAPQVPPQGAGMGNMPPMAPPAQQPVPGAVSPW